MDSSLDLDAPFKSFQKRLRAGELGTPHLDDQNRRLYGLPSQIAVREAFVADRQFTLDRLEEMPTWRLYGKAR